MFLVNLLKLPHPLQLNNMLSLETNKNDATSANHTYSIHVTLSYYIAYKAVVLNVLLETINLTLEKGGINVDLSRIYKCKNAYTNH